MLAFDLDRTLLTEDYELPAPILDAIMEAASRGHMVTVLTGRQFGSAKPFIDQLEIALPHSTNHGARIRDPEGQELRRVLMQGTDADLLLAEYLEDHDIEFSCVIDDTLYVRDPASERWNWVHAASRTINPYKAGLDLEYDKVIFHAQRSRELYEMIKAAHPQFLRYLWGDGYLEVVPSGADKGSALAYIADLLDVPRSEVVAFGDGANDVSMIEWAGTGVAVGHDAHPDVVANAQERVSAPEDGGVAEWIKRNLL